MRLENKIRVLLVILIVGTMIQTVQAQFPLTPFTTVECSSNTTLRIENLEERCIDGVCKNFSTTKEEFCPFSCNNDNNTMPSCTPSPFDVNVWVVAPIVGFFLIVIILAMRRLS